MQAMSNILGGGMPSRRFERVREESGLCYPIYSFTSSYLDSGYFGVYTALGRQTEMQALSLIRRSSPGLWSRALTNKRWPAQ